MMRCPILNNTGGPDAHPVLKIIKHRFLKFGTVGASGILVNLIVLWTCQELLFSWVIPESIRLNLSLAISICLSTFSNYCWNRFWTWQDRKEIINKRFWNQMVEYFTVCQLAIAMQVVFTNLLQLFMHYLLANVIANALAAIINYKANDMLTFSGRSIFCWIVSLCKRTKG